MDNFNKDIAEKDLRLRLVFLHSKVAEYGMLIAVFNSEIERLETELVKRGREKH